MQYTDEFLEGFIKGLDWVLNTCCQKELTEGGREQVRKMRAVMLKEKVDRIKEGL